MEYTNSIIKVFDFFSGCGGTSCGFKAAGLEIAMALDIDPDSEKTFTANFPGVPFLQRDIRKMKPIEINGYVKTHHGSPMLFCGCAPCQPFTKQNTDKPNDTEDGRRSLLGRFGVFIEYYTPEFVFVENVPGIQKPDTSGSSEFEKFIALLKKHSYHMDFGVIAAQNYGVPQRRRRLVLIASRLGEIKLPLTTHGPGTIRPYETVSKWICIFPPIAAGETHPRLANHRAAALSPINIERISAGKDRTEWPPELWLKCHKGEYKGHSDVYGRMKWDEPATGLTTRCISLSNGRFGHPEQNRAISVREAASLQTFPYTFIFHGSLNSMARQIGNAVPVQLAKTFGLHFITHLEKQMREEKADGKD